MTSVDPTEDLTDNLGQVDRIRAIIAARLPLEPIPLPPQIARHEAEFGWHDLALYRAPKLDRISFHHFFIKGRLREHLVLGWPGPGHDIPALGLDIYEHATDFTLVADLIPFNDLAWARDYYARYYGRVAEIVREAWTDLVPYLPGPPPAPDLSFTRQMGSALNIQVKLDYAALERACQLQADLAAAWCDLWERSEPLTGEARERYDTRRPVLIGAFKHHDYDSGASKAMARVVGQEITDGLFEAIFGPGVPQ